MASNTIIILIIIYGISLFFVNWWFDRAYNHKHGYWKVFTKKQRVAFYSIDKWFIFLPILNTIVMFSLFIIYGPPYKNPNKL